MEKLPRSRGIRKGKGSNVGAVAGGTDTAPGRREGSPHGSNARRTKLGRVEYWSWLTVRPVGDGLCQLVRCDMPTEFGVVLLSVLVNCDSVVDAITEAKSWSEGLGLPIFDLGFDPSPNVMRYTNWHRAVPSTWDPAAGWPL